MGKHRELKEQLAAKEEELRTAAGTLVLFSSGGTLAQPLGVALEIRTNCVIVGPNLKSCLFSSTEFFFFAAEVLSWRTQLLQADHYYDRLDANTVRLGIEAAQARAEAASARRSLDEANQLHAQLAGYKSRLEAEVELLKAEAAKVVETLQALVEVDQQRGQLDDDKGRLQAEVDRLWEQATVAEEARQDETRRHQVAEEKDAEMKAALAKAADLEKALGERDRVMEWEQCGTLLEAQHLEESFTSKCCFL